MAKQQELDQLIQRLKAANESVAAKIQTVIDAEGDNISEDSLKALNEVIGHTEEIGGVVADSSAANAANAASTSDTPEASQA